MILNGASLLGGRVTLPEDVCCIIESKLISEEDVRLRCTQCDTSLLADLCVRPIQPGLPILWFMRGQDLYVRGGPHGARRLVPCLPFRNPRAPMYQLPLALPGKSGYAPHAPPWPVQRVRVGPRWYLNQNVQMHQMAWYKALSDGCFLCARCFCQRRCVRRSFLAWRRL